MPRRRRHNGRRQPKRTARIITAYRSWTDRVPRGKRYLHMRVLPTFFVETATMIGGATVIMLVCAQYEGTGPTPLLFMLAFWLGLFAGTFMTVTEVAARPDRVIW